ncbi:MAG: nucleotidyltransferase domain-containing protein [Campylobacterota bacterium]|nr:nucleotidyltransferase domain-containing protein [Campylobacterota bacterium]
MKIDKSNIISFLKEIKTELVANGISTIGLFGSFARDEAGVYSDIDIAIKKESGYLKTRTAYDYFNEVSKIKSLIRKKFHRNSDVFDLESDSSMKNEIIKDLIYV